MLPRVRRRGARRAKLSDSIAAPYRRRGFESKGYSAGWRDWLPFVSTHQGHEQAPVAGGLCADDLAPGVEAETGGH